MDEDRDSGNSYRALVDFTYQGEVKNEPVCEKYALQRAKMWWMNQILPNTIVAVNVAIRMGVIVIINKIRISTESVEMKYITNAVFLSIFFNTGLLIMLCNSNLED